VTRSNGSEPFSTGKRAEEEARAKWAAIKKTDDAKKDQGSDRAKAYLMKVRKELGAAVEAGKISEEDAKKRYQGVERAIKERMADARAKGRSRTVSPEDLGRAGIEIRKAVAEGKISAAEGRAKMEAVRKMIGEQREGATRNIDWEGTKRRIEGAVKRGDITREEADAKYKEIKYKEIKYKEIKKRMAGRRDR